MTIKILPDPGTVFKNPPSFTKPLYEGTLNGDGTLVVEKIAVNSDSFDGNVKLEIVNDFDGTFGLVTIDEEVKLTILNLSLDILRSRFLNIVLKASKPAEIDVYSTISIQIDSSEQKQPLFEKTFYEGSLSEKGRTFVLEEISLKEETYSSDVQFQFNGMRDDLFDFSVNRNKILVWLKESANLEEIAATGFLRFTISAIKPDFASSMVDVVIKTIPEVLSSPEFEKDFYIGELIDNTIVIEDILLNEESFDESISITVE